VQYQAIRTATDVQTDIGTFTTPTEPGTQVIDLGMQADHVSLLGSAAVTEAGRLWTTDRAVSLTAGHAVAETDQSEQAGWGASVWPRAGHDSAAVAGGHALHLLYQDGDDLAGRTRASVTGLDSDLRLRYDRVYNGPHKLGSTARHVVAYMAMKGGDAMRPAVGAVPMPGPQEHLQVDCGFEPAMVEVTISGAPLGEEIANWAAPQPFGWSEGTAISDDGGLRQYVLHHAFTPAAGVTDPTAAVESGGVGTASTDGGTPTEQTEPADPVAATPETDSGDGPDRVPSPTAVPDDGIVGLSLLQGADGAVLGRDECRIESMTATGFEVAVDRIATEQAPPSSRSTLVYRAWPAVDGRSGQSADDQQKRSDSMHQHTQTDQEENR
jgi:hypothetical protein